MKIILDCCKYKEEFIRRNPCQNFFSLDNDELVKANAGWFEGHLMYIQGAIIITINGKKILDFKDWDYPYWLYGQFVGFLDDIKAGKGFEMPYLESDTLIKVESISKSIVLLKHIVQGKTVNHVNYDKKELFISFLEAALKAFKVSDKYDGEDCGNDILDLEDCLKYWMSR